MTDTGAIRVLVADDHDVVRAGLIALLESDEVIQIAGEARNGAEAVEGTGRLHPDVVLMDIRMPVMDGFQATSKIRKEYPDVRILVVTHLSNEAYARRFMRSGASGYVPKSCAAQELKHAIHEVHAGRQYCSITMEPAPLQARTGQGPGTRGVTLTPREREVLRLVASGRTNLEISMALQISIRTVEFHRANLIEKIGSKDAISLVRCAIEQHLIQLEPAEELPSTPVE